MDGHFHLCFPPFPQCSDLCGKIAPVDPPIPVGTPLCNAIAAPPLQEMKSVCWGRSLRGCDHQVTSELDSGNQRLLTSFPVRRMWVPLAFPAPRCCPRK